MNSINTKQKILYPLAVSFVLINGVVSYPTSGFSLTATDEHSNVFQQNAYRNSHETYIIPAINSQKNKAVKYSSSNKDDVYTIDDSKVAVLRKIDRIKHLTNNWNGYGAKPFDDEVIKKAENMAVLLSYTPEVYPTANGTLQFEYHKSDGAYLEFEVSENNAVPVYIENKEGSEKEFEVTDNSYEELNKIVKAFYEC